MAIAILYREELKEYDFGIGHPFRGDRYPLFMHFLKSRLTPDNLYNILHAKTATMEDLLKICDPDYIEFNKEYYQAAAAGWVSYYENFSHYQSIDNKPIGTPGKLEEAARMIIGQAKMACDLVQNGEYQKIICIGGGMHHARRRFGEGFCIYNDVAFSALYLIERYQLDRVMVIDTDAHAGNGTADYLRSNPKVLFVDIHQDPQTIYPGTGFVQEIGADAAKGLTFNISLPAQAGNESYLLVFDKIIFPLVQEFQPQMIIRNGGSDPHFHDGLTNLGMTITGFRAIGDKVRELSEICQGRQIDLIASGYNSQILPFAWLALISGITNFPVSVEEPEPIPPQFEQDVVISRTEEMLEDVKKYHRDYWKCFRNTLTKYT